MAVYTYEDVATPLVANTTMQIRLKDGVPYQYLITPNDGYVLHDTAFDYLEVVDEETGEEVLVLGYRRSTASCSVNYDFTTNSRQFYAILESEVPDPENQIFGGDNDHEVM